MLAGGRKVLVKQGADLPTVCGGGLGEGLAAPSCSGSGSAGCSCVLVAIDLRCRRNMGGCYLRCLSLQIQLSKQGCGAMSSVSKHPLPDELLSGVSGTLVQEDSAMLHDTGRLMALPLPLSYPSFGCNWKQLSAMEEIAGTVSPDNFFCFVFGLIGVCFFDFNKILLLNFFYSFQFDWQN